MPEAKFALTVPIDVSGVSEFKKGQAARIAVRDGNGKVHSQVVKVDERGSAEATFPFDENPGSVQIVLGPEDADNDEIFSLQTMQLSAGARQFRATPKLKLPVVKIPPFYWLWWLRWCFTFTIRGRVVCPDGSPVPGAKVCAYDVDWWWWWSGLQQIGCDTTDMNGAFAMKVRWCCGWFPWYWWRLRHWRIEPSLVDKIGAALRLTELGQRIPRPTPAPSLKLFESLLGGQVLSPTLPLPPPRRPLQPGIEPDPVDTKQLDTLRERLLRVLPSIPELERLQVWPWIPWTPWWDCRPDIIFRATQVCDGVEKVVVSENFSSARWNVTSDLSVTLVAHDACCAEHNQDPPGNCTMLTSACGALITNIGGNLGAPAAPVGYANPGSSDNPFSENIELYGQFGSLSGVDYYRFEYAPYAGVVPPDPAFAPVPIAAAGGFARTYLEGVIIAGNFTIITGAPVFNLAPVDSIEVFESREHYEETHDPAKWGVSRVWSSHRDLLMVLRSKDNFGDGNWYFRVRGYQLLSNGKLKDLGILPVCGGQTPNGMVIRVDNRQILASAPWTSPAQPCGATGPVHLCTTEPDTQVVAVRVDGQVVKPCDMVRIQPNSVVQIEFFAYDENGHLSFYELRTRFGENQSPNLLALATPVPAALAGVPVPAAPQVGPTYAQAKVQGAAAPVWRGGSMVLTLTGAALQQAFPQPCAYQIFLKAWRRNIVNCGSTQQVNESQYSFTVTA